MKRISSLIRFKFNDLGHNQVWRRNGASSSATSRHRVRVESEDEKGKAKKEKEKEAKDRRANKAEKGSEKSPRNELGIQMIPESMRRQLFGDIPPVGVKEMAQKSTKPESDLFNEWGPSGERLSRDPQEEMVSQTEQGFFSPPASAPPSLQSVKSHLRKHGFWDKRQDKPAFEMTSAPEPRLELPPLQGKDIEEHFYNIGAKYSQKYKHSVDNYLTKRLPTMPSLWEFEPGWTRYETDSEGNILSKQSVPHPVENVLVFDVEVSNKDGNYHYPTLATAVSDSAWYSWVSQRLVDLKKDDSNSTQLRFDGLKEFVSTDDLIPMGRGHEERVIVGHNVSFDRAFIREQYDLASGADKMRFVDTMSLHMSVSGLTGYQRALSFSYNAAKKRGAGAGTLRDMFKARNHPNPLNWEDTGSLNNLLDVHAFYCKHLEGEKLTKEPRDVFVKGTLADVCDNFQLLMSYCAKDVKATSDVLTQLWPKFLERFPHPVTLAGMLEMSVMYLPVNVKTWGRYLTEAQTTYDDLQRELTLSLIHLANGTCGQLKQHEYKRDVWTWDLDWSTQEPRFRKNMKDPAVTPEVGTQEEGAKKARKPRKSKKQAMLVDQDKDEEQPEGGTDDNVMSLFTRDIYKTGKSLNKVQPRLAGYPQWYREFCESPFSYSTTGFSEDAKEWAPGPYLISTQMRSVPKLMRLMWDGFAFHFDKKHGWGYLVPHGVDKSLLKQVSEDRFPYEEYIKIVKPMRVRSSDHIQGNNFDITETIVFTSECDDSEECLPEEEDVKRDGFCEDVDVFGCRFYKLPHKDGPENRVGNPLGREFLRYVEQGRLTAYGNDTLNMVLKLSKTVSYWKMNQKRISGQLVVTPAPSDECPNPALGAILPRVVVAGTVTRRAVEPTWLTASNAYIDRVGSELKAMISAPEGHRFVGADVDSQELWIASLLGDSLAGIHGSTGIGWMTLQGTKAQGTDLHTKSANLVNISRADAKVLNYGRIYGAGKAFAARFLTQSNPDLSEEEARKKAREIYKQTKGLKSGGHWKGGTESDMFNKLEEIARGFSPALPVLGGRISRALEADGVKDYFVTSLVNWVVQSSAVDYLHLMLVSMQWLIDTYEIRGRFCISIHDEVRYLVIEEDALKAAFALQVTNLLTRSMFASRLGFKDLPLSVAFFSAVDVDTVLRKEVDMDCKTPSNPNGLKLGYSVSPGQSLDINSLLGKDDIKRLIVK